ncbi:hypothetical protein GCM10027062_27100 [Nocardioides hungaricus]
MQLLTLVPDALILVADGTDPTPQPDDVKAGWLAFGIFIALIVAVALLGYSLTRQLRKAKAAEEAGLYDPSDKRPATEPEPADDEADNGSTA